MNKKCITNVLALLLLFLTPKAVAMNWEKYIVPIIGFSVAVISLAALLCIKNYSKNSAICCSLKEIPEIEDYNTFCDRQPTPVKYGRAYDNYARIFYKKCKVVLNSPDVCNSCRKRFFTSIKEQTPHLIRRFLCQYHTRIVMFICLLACKFNDSEIALPVVDDFLSKTNFYLDAATLFKGKEMVYMILQRDHIKILKQESPQEIIERNLKGNRYQYDLVANFFETMLHRAKTDGNKAAITKLLDTTLKDKIDEQLDLLFIVIKHKYKLLEETLKKLFGLTLASKNSKNQTLFHCTYLLRHRFDYHSRNPESLVSVIKRLCDEQVCGINDPDSAGKTPLYYAIQLYNKLCSSDLRDDYRQAHIKHGIKKFGLKLLLTHPSIDLTIKDGDMPLIWKFFEYSPCVIKDILARENFDPYQVQYENMNFLSKFFMIIADGYYEGGSLDFTRFYNKSVMTQSLQHLVKDYNTSFNCIDGGIYENLETLISLYTLCGGSVSESDKNQLAAVDIAHSMYIASKEQYNALLHANNKTDYKQNEAYHRVFSNHTKTELGKALTSFKTKEILYHLYLTKIPYANQQWHIKYLLLKQKLMPVEIAQYISKLCFNLTIEREIDRTIAYKSKKYFDLAKLEKERVDELIKNSTHDVDGTVITTPEYYRKNQNEKEQCRQEVLQKMLSCTSSS